MFESFLGVNPWTALFILLNTLTIFFVARKFLFGPVMKIIADRQQEIDDLYAGANSAKAEAEACAPNIRRSCPMPAALPSVLSRKLLPAARPVRRTSSARPTPMLLPFWTRHPLILLRKRRRPSTMPRTKFPASLWPLPARLLAGS